MSKEDIRELAEDNAIYEFNKFKKIYGNYTDEYVRHFYNKLAELRGGIDDVHTCNCQHNNNPRDNEPCCRCDSRHTNADRIRNMSDEELTEFLVGFKNTFGEEYEGEASCMEWLQSEAEWEINIENTDARVLLQHIYNTYGYQISKNFKDNAIRGAFELADKALEKQIPKKPDFTEDKEFALCPCCNGKGLFDKQKYCDNCGQKIVWSEESEE